MKKEKKEDETAVTANASDTTEDSSSEETSKEASKENLDESKELKDSKVDSKPTKEEITSDYLEPEDKVDYKKRYGDSTREYQTLKTEKEKLSSAITNLEKLAEKNPKILAEIEAAQGNLSRDDSGNSTLIQQQIEKALEPVKKIASDLQERDRQAKVKVLATFEKKNPKLFSPKTTKEEKREIRQRIGKVANALEETGMSFKQAVNRAYFTVNPKAAVQKGKDEAYLEGLGENQASFSSQASTQGKKSGKPKYTKAELEKAKKFGEKYYKSMIKEK